MDKLYRKLKFTTGSTYNINVVLEEKFTLIGTYNDDETSIISPEYNDSDTSIVSGYTENRLSDVETYDTVFPYKVGMNGVTFVGYKPDSTIDYVEYNIDGIDYKTIFDDFYTTTYSYIARGIDSLTGINFSLIKNDKILGINQKPEVLSFVNIERQEISVFDPFYRLKNIKNIGDLLTYGGGKFFNIE